MFKKLFSHEEITFEDMCETKSVKDALYLDMNEKLPDVSEYEKEHTTLWKDICDMTLPHDAEMERKCARAEELSDLIAQGHNYVFIGKVGQFCPMMDGFGGGVLLRQTDNKKTGEKGYAAVTGTKGYRWMESEMVRQLDKQDGIDRSYYDAMVDAAIQDISGYGDFEWFVSEDPYVKVEDDTPPWESPGEPWQSDDNIAFDVR